MDNRSCEIASNTVEVDCDRPLWKRQPEPLHPALPSASRHHRDRHRRFSVPVHWRNDFLFGLFSVLPLCSPREKCFKRFSTKYCRRPRPSSSSVFSPRFTNLIVRPLSEGISSRGHEHGVLSRRTTIAGLYQQFVTNTVRTWVLLRLHFLHLVFALDRTRASNPRFNS